MRKRLIRQILCFTLAALFLSSPVLADDIEGYGEDIDDTEDAFAEAYGWDTDKIDSDTWTDDEGNEYSRLSWGYDDVYYDQMVEAIAEEYGINISESINDDYGQNIVDVALSQVGQYRSIWTTKGYTTKYHQWYGLGISKPWCATFVSWCADQCGYIDSGLFKKTASSGGTFRYLCKTGNSHYYVGESCAFGGSEQTVPGDIILFHDTSAEYGTYNFEHIGIVVGVSDGELDVVEGNAGDRVQYCVYTMKDMKGDARFYGGGQIVHVVYPSNEETIFKFLTTKCGLNDAVACGLLANISAESGFNYNSKGDAWTLEEIEDAGASIYAPDHSEGSEWTYTDSSGNLNIYTSYGLCQWHNSKWGDLQQYCDAHGYRWNSLSGQLMYLQYDIAQHSSISLAFEQTENTAQGAYNAAYIWCTQYERPANASVSGVARGNKAKDVYWPKYDPAVRTEQTADDMPDTLS